MRLESDKKDIENALEAERSLLADKDILLTRSKQSEAKLEADLDAMQIEIDTLDGQLTRALSNMKGGETK